MKKKTHFLILIFACIITLYTACDDIAPEPYLSGVGIAVNDLSLSTSYYTEALGMSLKCRPVKIGKYKETRLHFPESTASDLILRKYIGRGTGPDLSSPIPAKLVFYVEDAVAVFDAVLAKGGSAVSPPTFIPAYGVTVAMTRDINGYLNEIVQEPYYKGYDYMGAVGLGVSDLATSTSYCTDNLGIGFLYNLPVQAGPILWMTESIMQFPAAQGSGIVLMEFNETYFPQDYTTNPLRPVKLYISVKSVFGYLAGIPREDITSLFTLNILDGYEVLLIQEFDIEDDETE